MPRKSKPDQAADDLHDKKRSQMHNAASRRRTTRLKQYDPSVHTTTHDPSCGMFQFLPCDCSP